MSTPPRTYQRTRKMYLPTRPRTNPPTHPSIYPSTHPPTCPPTHLPAPLPLISAAMRAASGSLSRRPSTGTRPGSSCVLMSKPVLTCITCKPGRDARARLVPANTAPSSFVSANRRHRLPQAPASLCQSKPVSRLSRVGRSTRHRGWVAGVPSIKQTCAGTYVLLSTPLVVQTQAYIRLVCGTGV